MKLLSTFTAAALAGLAAASPADSAEVFILQQRQPNSPASPPQIPRQIARHILLHRAGVVSDSLLDDVPKGTSAEDAISFVRHYGKQMLPGLFVETGSVGRQHSDAAQLVLLLEGASPQIMKEVKAYLGEAHQTAAFSIIDTPSSKANSRLLDEVLASSGKEHSSCDVASAVNPYNRNCWTDSSFINNYDLAKSDNLAAFTASLANILKLVGSGDLEAMLLLFPESTRSSSINNWTTMSTPRLRSRAAQAEAVMFEKDAASTTTSKTTSPSHTSKPPFVAPAKPTLLPCYKSYNACVTNTGNCTNGHGVCRDKYATGSGSSKRQEGDDNKKAAVCFACHCMATVNHVDDDGSHEQTTHWGGAVCQKQDISTPFWLIVGFTVTMIGTISFAIGLLFNVGEEKLPGVIGAGVSRSK